MTDATGNPMGYEVQALSGGWEPYQHDENAAIAEALQEYPDGGSASMDGTLRLLYTFI